MDMGSYRDTSRAVQSATSVSKVDYAASLTSLIYSGIKVDVCLPTFPSPVSVYS